MNKQYTIPAAVALSLHAVLLFGFRGRPPVVGPTDAPAAPVDSWTVVQIVDIPPVVDDQSDDPTAKPQRGNPEVGNPGLPELPQDPGPIDFVIAANLTPPRRFDTDRINHGPLGVPDGVIDGISTTVSTLDSRMLDSSPRTRNQVAPLYPSEARVRGADGSVLVGFIVDETGRVLNPHAIECTDRIFEDAAVRAVAKWRFEPGRSHGRIVRFRMAVPIIFRMNE